MGSPHNELLCAMQHSNKYWKTHATPHAHAPLRTCARGDSATTHLNNRRLPISRLSHEQHALALRNARRDALQHAQRVLRVRERGARRMRPRRHGQRRAPHDQRRRRQDQMRLPRQEHLEVGLDEPPLGRKKAPHPRARRARGHVAQEHVQALQQHHFSILQHGNRQYASHIKLPAEETTKHEGSARARMTHTYAGEYIQPATYSMAAHASTRTYAPAQ
jgi:hypothetical protein